MTLRQTQGHIERSRNMKTKKPLVAIIMGSDSDLPVMKQACEILEEFNMPYEITIVSAHRTPDRMFEYAKNAHSRGIKVIIAGAGGAAHLPGMTASISPLPVIGVPIKTSALSGVDSLYSIVQMPKGMPVATVAINGAFNAGLLAVKILAQLDPKLLDKVKKYHREVQKRVEKKAQRLEKVGYKKYVIRNS